MILAEVVPAPFEDQTVIITGAGKGLGRGYALLLASLGANVVVNNRSHAGEGTASADAVVAEIQSCGGHAIADYSDVEDPAAGQRLLDTALEQFGRLDAVVANAGIAEGRSFRKQNLDDFRQVIEINLMGTVNILHPAFCHLYDQGGGSIVVSTSVAGLYGEHGLPAYSAAKAALLGLMYSLSLEGKAHNVRVNALAPYGSTQMTENELPPALRTRMSPERVAPVLAWLVSRDCPLTGEIIISGAARMSRAHMRETSVAAIPGDPDFSPDKLNEMWKNLQGQPLDRSHVGAIEHFKAFIATN